MIGTFGCAPLQPYDGVHRPAKSEIDIYEGGHEPSKPYKVIMSFSEGGHIGDEADKHRDFVAKAKALGADGIILKPSQFRTSYGPFGGTDGAFSAIAIVYQ